MPTPSKKRKKNDPSYRRAGAKRYPVERVQTYAVSAGSSILIDVAKTLSAQNHRLYRQGKMYHIKLGLTSHAPQAGDLVKQEFKIYTIPDTWYVKKAWELAMATRDEQLSLSNRSKGRWDDFRVGWSSALQTGTLGVSGDMGSLSSDEAQLSKVHDAVASNDYGFVMFGASRDTGNTLYGMIEQYDQTGNTPLNQPGGVAASDAYTQAHPDSGMVEGAGDLKALQGDMAPYDMDSFNGADDGGSVMQPSITSTEDGVGRSSLSLWAPLGLLKVTNDGAATSSLTVTVSSGQYKGVKAIDF